MSPPPATPTPRRFLLPKRATQSSQTPATAPRFQSTPRFGSSSVPRPTQRDRHVEDVDEEDDRIEESSLEDEGRRGNVPLNDSIEIESDEFTEDEGPVSSPGGSQTGVQKHAYAVPMGRQRPSVETLSPEGREAKRRKVSISPMPESSPFGSQAQDLNFAQHEDHMTHRDSHDEDEDSPASIDGGQSLSEDEAEARVPQQPVFQAAPRFKPVSPGPATDGLPAAFSPQRRGARYLAGGLAAELQGWLSDVKGQEGVDGAAEAVLRVAVADVRPGRRMYLVTGTGDVPRRFMLAGEGRLTGLGKRAVVGVGSMVVLGQPVWDVELDGELWTVACDWSVE